MFKHVLLIFGEPDSGKSWLASELQAHYGYATVALDDVYIQFVQEKYPKLYLESLNIVVSQHYRTILSQERHGERDWRKYAIQTIKDTARANALVAVEGYLLEPILGDVYKAISKVAKVTTIQVIGHQYFPSVDIDELHKMVTE